MNNFDQARLEYENTPLPPELGERVQAGIRQGKANRRRRRMVQRFMGCAACFAVMLAALNLSPTLAKAAADVPVLGGLFQVMTFTRYDLSDGGINYTVSVPRLETDGSSSLAETVNTAIQERVDLHMERARQDWADYKDAFFETGGTEEEWGGREMDVYVGYDVMSQTDTRVSFVVSLAEGWVASMEEHYYYNLDFAEGRNLTLQDLLGDDWVEICNDAINTQIAASVDDEGFTLFFTPEEGGFTTVDESTSFYIREDGVPVVAFPRYAIAAGAAGIPEFPIE